jgi:hypothetical protein
LLGFRSGAVEVAVPLEYCVASLDEGVEGFQIDLIFKGPVNIWAFENWR